MSDDAAAGDGARYLLPAELTHANSDRVRAELLDAARQAPGARLVVDCRDVEVLGPVELAFLVAAAEVLRHRSGRLELVHPSSAALRELRGSGLDKVLTVVADRFEPRPWSDIN